MNEQPTWIEEADGTLTSVPPGRGARALGHAFEPGRIVAALCGVDGCGQYREGHPHGADTASVSPRHDIAYSRVCNQQELFCAKTSTHQVYYGQYAIKCPWCEDMIVVSQIPFGRIA